MRFGKLREGRGEKQKSDGISEDNRIQERRKQIENKKEREVAREKKREM